MIASKKRPEYIDIQVFKVGLPHVTPAGIPSGILINDGKHRFVLSLYEFGYDVYVNAIGFAYARKADLPTAGEWKIISDHCDEINYLLKSVNGNLLQDVEYWSREQINSLSYITQNPVRNTISMSNQNITACIRLVSYPTDDQVADHNRFIEVI